MNPFCERCGRHVESCGKLFSMEAPCKLVLNKRIPYRKDRFKLCKVCRTEIKLIMRMERAGVDIVEISRRNTFINLKKIRGHKND